MKVWELRQKLDGLMYDDEVIISLGEVRRLIESSPGGDVRIPIRCISSFDFRRLEELEEGEALTVRTADAPPRVIGGFVPHDPKQPTVIHYES